MEKNKLKKVPLHLVYDAIESANEVYDQYLDTDAMEVVSLPNMDSDFAEVLDEDEELMELIENDKYNRFLPLPSQFDLQEYSVMEDYIDELEDKQLAQRLARAIRGRGAFRRFKDILIDLGKIQSWYDYQDQYYWNFARRWCRGYNLEFLDDQKENERK